MEIKKYRNTELKNPHTCYAVRRYCINNGIYYETSDAGNGYVHFEILCTEKEAKEINAVIDKAEAEKR